MGCRRHGAEDGLGRGRAKHKQHSQHGWRSDRQTFQRYPNCGKATGPSFARCLVTPPKLKGIVASIVLYCTVTFQQDHRRRPLIAGSRARRSPRTRATFFLRSIRRRGCALRGVDTVAVVTSSASSDHLIVPSSRRQCPPTALRTEACT